MDDQELPDEQKLSNVRELLRTEHGAHGWLGAGLKAIYNHALFERLPDGFKRLIERLGKVEDPRDPHLEENE